MDTMNVPYKINKENTKVKRFWDELEQNKLMTTECKDCQTLHWPPRSFCTTCYSENLDWTDLPTSGTLVTFTKVTAPAEGFSKDGYILGIVQLKNTDLRVFGQVHKNASELYQGIQITLHIEEDENKFKYFNM